MFVPAIFFIVTRESTNENRIEDCHKSLISRLSNVKNVISQPFELLSILWIKYSTFGAGI